MRNANDRVKSEPEKQFHFGVRRQEVVTPKRKTSSRNNFTFVCEKKKKTSYHTSWLYVNLEECCIIWFKLSSLRVLLNYLVFWIEKITCNHCFSNITRGADKNLLYLLIVIIVIFLIDSYTNWLTVFRVCC